MKAVVLAAGVFLFVLGWAQNYGTSSISTKDTIRLEELAQGRWALLFVVIPGCPACVEVIGWLGRVVTVFPKIRFAVVAPKITAELVACVESQGLGSALVHDPRGTFGGGLGVKRAPTLIFLVDGVTVGRLDWRFSEEDVRRELTRSLEIRALSDLLGEPSPDFRALSLSGEPLAFSELPRPLLLVFFNPGCPPCWEVLPALAEIAQEVGVALLTFVDEAGLSSTDRTRLEAFLKETRGKPVTVLLVRDPDVLWTYGLTGSPSFVLVDGKGVISWVWSGPIKSVDLVVAVRPALNRAIDSASGK